MTTITGTLANDTLFGTDEDWEIIYGLGGDDIIYQGSGGYAYAYGGVGNDTIYMGEGRSVDADGGDGNDRIISGAVNSGYLGWVDNLNGGFGDDTYVWNANSKRISIKEGEVDIGVDTLEFGAGINLQDLIINGFQGGSKDWEIRYSSTWTSNADIHIDGPNSTSPYENPLERIVFANGDAYTIVDSKTLLADDNDNLVYLAKGSAVFDGGGGDDIIHGTSDTAMLGNYGEVDYIYGGDGNDTIYGYEGHDTIYGGNGDDYLHAGTGLHSDQLYGGNGDDVIIGGNHHTGGYSTNVWGGDGNDTVYINGHSGLIQGEAGSDEVHHNFMYTQDSAGSLGRLIGFRGGSDNDVYIFNKDNTANTISTKSSIVDDSGLFDTIVLSGDWNPNEIVLQYGGIGLEPSFVYNVVEINTNFTNNYIERISFSNGDIYSYDQLTSSISQIVSTSGNDTLYLTAWHDDFHAGDGDDTIYALERDDIVDGGAGNDTLYGEHGSDTLIGGLGNDILNGGIGVDTVDYSSAAAGVDITLSGDVVTDDGDGGSDQIYNIENLTGSEFGDDLRADNNDNVVIGNAGADTIYGYNGNDTIDGGADNDYINAGDGDDVVDGGDGRDTIYASYGNDTLYGGDDVDKLYGGAGDNTLNGGDGIDLLYSGSGADTFVLENISHLQGGSVYDRVYNFDEAEGDVIDISDLVSDYNAGTDDINDFVVLLEYGNDMLVRVDGDGTGASMGETNVARLYNYNGWDGLTVQNVIDSGELIV